MWRYDIRVGLELTETQRQQAGELWASEGATVVRWTRAADGTHVLTLDSPRADLGSEYFDMVRLGPAPSGAA